jgi:hypothetical protein
MEFKEEDLKILRLLGEHVNTLKNDIIVKAFYLLSFTLFNLFNNNYFKNY